MQEKGELPVEVAVIREGLRWEGLEVSVQSAQGFIHVSPKTLYGWCLEKRFSSVALWLCPWIDTHPAFLGHVLV